MSSRFVALPVTQGDSFYLERDNKVILFDGGRYPQQTPQLFQAVATKNEIDYLICSHNDADHALGIIGLFESSIPIKEVWLPGRWKDIIIDIGSNKNWVEEVLLDALKTKPEDLDRLDEEVEEIDRSSSEDETNNEKNPEIDDSFDDILEEICESEEYFYPIGHPRYPGGYFGSQVFVDMIAASNRILTIAKLAYASGTKIRWFDFKEFEKTHRPRGGEKFLLPLNSVELTRKRKIKSKLKLFKKLYLSVSNKESLVFCSQVKGEPSVLFTADSNLHSVVIPTLANTKEMLATSPHHGSYSNSNVYKLFNKTSPIWVRSDMKAKKRPCREYIGQSLKYCTICNHYTKPQVEIEFFGSGAIWTSTNNPCSCT